MLAERNNGQLIRKGAGISLVDFMAALLNELTPGMKASVSAPWHLLHLQQNGVDLDWVDEMVRQLKRQFGFTVVKTAEGLVCLDVPVAAVYRARKLAIDAAERRARAAAFLFVKWQGSSVLALLSGALASLAEAVGIFAEAAILPELLLLLAVPGATVLALRQLRAEV